MILAASCAAWLTPTLAKAARSCSVSTTAANFGAYKSTDASAKTARGEVLVTCTCSGLDCVGFSYQMNVQAGGSTDVNNRRMTRQEGGGDTLNYQLYSDALYLLPWVANVGQGFIITNYGSGQTVYVYGKAAAGQAVRTGTYKDTPGVVITY